MSGPSTLQFLIMMVMAGLLGFPISKILQRTGHSGWWAILYFFPFLNIICLWIFALKKWPTDYEEAKNC